MDNFSSERHMQCEIFFQLRRKNIFPKYKIYGKNYKGIEYPCGKHRSIDFLLEHESEEYDFKVVELKESQDKKKKKEICGTFAQICIYVYLLKKHKEFGEKAKISVEIIADYISDRLKNAVRAKGSEIKEPILRNEENEKKYPKLKDQMKKELGDDYDTNDIEYDFTKKKSDYEVEVLKPNDKTKNKLLVVLFVYEIKKTRKGEIIKGEIGLDAFGQLFSAIWKCREKNKGKEISGIIIGNSLKKTGEETGEEFEMSMRGNELMKDIKVGLYEYSRDGEELTLGKDLTLNQRQ